LWVARSARFQSADFALREWFVPNFVHCGSVRKESERAVLTAYCQPHKVLDYAVAFFSGIAVGSPIALKASTNSTLSSYVKAFISAMKAGIVSFGAGRKPNKLLHLAAKGSVFSSGIVVTLSIKPGVSRFCLTPSLYTYPADLSSRSAVFFASCGDSSY
jgi:hypothetical protein